jgi:hypothetical protein
VAAAWRDRGLLVIGRVALALGALVALPGFAMAVITSWAEDRSGPSMPCPLAGSRVQPPVPFRVSVAFPADGGAV